MNQRKPSRIAYLTSGILKENPVLVLMIGLCPVLATTTSARDGLGMAAAASFVLLGSNFVVSLVRRLVPESIRIPIFIIIISTFVTIIDYVLQAYQPALYSVLGVFVPLIVVNCIILGRAEAFAYHHGILDSVLDGLGKSLGLALVLFLMGSIRELLAAGTWFALPVMPAGFRESPALIMVFSPGAFLLIGILKALLNKLSQPRKVR